MWIAIQNVLLVIAVCELALLTWLLRSYVEPVREANKVFVRFPSEPGFSFALTERTVHELQSQGFNIIVEPNQ